MKNIHIKYFVLIRRHPEQNTKDRSFKFEDVNNIYRHCLSISLNLTHNLLSNFVRKIILFSEHLFEIWS